MRARARGFALTCGVLALLSVTGCSLVRGSLHAIGLESRASRLARQYRQEKLDLAAKNAEQEARLASAATRLKEAERKLKLAELERERLARAKLDRDKKRVVVGHKPAPTAASNWQRLEKALAGLGTPIVDSSGRRGIRLSGDIVFRSGKCGVTDNAKGLLRRVASGIRSLQEDVVCFVDGHTDSDPLVHTKHLYGDLYGLAAARANSVARELVAAGVPRRMLVTRSFGSDYPLGDNRTPTGKKKNRRVDITFAFGNNVKVSKGTGIR